VSSLAAPAAISAPTMMMPEIAFEPDMSGVCNVEGTFEMISQPNTIESMKMKNKKVSSVAVSIK
jgi:hypothetical protein